MPPDVPQYFSPEAAAAVATPLRPVVYGAVNVRFVDPKLKLDVTKVVRVTADLSDGPVAVDWDNGARVEWAPEMLETAVPDGVSFSVLPSPATKAKNYDAWARQLTASLSSGEALELFRSPSTGELSRPDESEREFRARLHQASRESRDEALEALRRKYAPKQAQLEERLRRAQQAVAREQEQATGQKLQTAISLGATLVGALFGRKSITATSLGRATTTLRGAGRTMKESEDVGRAQETVEAIQRLRQELDEELRAETEKFEAANDVATETLEKLAFKPKKTNLTVKLVALVWTK